MAKKTSDTREKFHIDLSSSNVSNGIYSHASFLNFKPIDPSPPVSEAHTSAAVIKPQEEAKESDVSETPEIPEIQETTHQVPCGNHSIFDPNENVPAFKRALYLVLNEHSNWDTGITHALSIRRLAKLLNVKSHSQIVQALKWLIDNDWIKVHGKRKSDGANFYRVIHHNCSTSEKPFDKDGRPLKCAVPMGAGSVSRLLEQGEITWRMFVDWTTRKIYSCWTTGVVSMAVRDAAKLVKLGVKTISENAKKMVEVGLLERVSEKFKLSVYQMFPKPYPQRRERTPLKCDSRLAMKCVGGWYYSYNGLWKFNRESFEVKMKEIDGRWRYSNLDELSTINKSIHRDFIDYMDFISKMHGFTFQA